MEKNQIIQTNEVLRIPQANERAQFFLACMERIGKISSIYIGGCITLALIYEFANKDCGANIGSTLSKIMPYIFTIKSDAN